MSELVTPEAAEYERRLNLERAAREAAEAAERRVRASEERLRLLQRVTAALSEAATPRDVAAVVLQHGLLAVSASAGAVYEVTADGHALELLGQRGHPEEQVAAFARMDLALRSPMTDAGRERAPGFYESYEACAASYPELRGAIRSGGFEGSVALPLLTRGTLRGVLGIRFVEKREFDESDRAFLLTLSELCAQALERARLFAAESEARAQAEAGNRAKDEFLAMLGHELRNPLAPIVTALNLMRIRGEGPLHERMVIERQVMHLARLLDDLLDVARITRGSVALKRERVELGTVVARAVEQSSALLEQRRQHLTLTVPDQGLLVHGDPARLSQVVSNLLTNAAKYTPSGGHIEVAAIRQGDRVELMVSDDGIGIVAAMLPRVFDLFAQEHQSNDRSQGGLGLGLAIVKVLVAMHEGTVSAFSEGHGKGSVFTVGLPLAQRGAQRGAQIGAQSGAQNGVDDGAQDSDAHAEDVAPRTARVPRAGRRVLVVDDNADAADLMGEWLAELGYEARIAHDGPAALESVVQFTPDFVLLDIGLPVMDGFEVARRLRAHMDPRPAPRFVAVTGYGQPVDRDRSTQEGFYAHLVKPIDFTVLGKILETRELSSVTSARG